MRLASIMAAAGFALGLAFALPAAAHAANAATTAELNMRAGPSVSFPVVAQLPEGAPVEIYGCVKDGSWCDTAWASERGWVAGAYLSSIYRGAPVSVAVYAPQIGYPVVVYDQTAYWNRYYVGRPWYGGRHLYVGPNHTCFRGPFVAGCR
jgi:uncharacterized protein YraI